MSGPASPEARAGADDPASTVGIEAMAYRLPETSRTLAELAATGRLVTSAEVLADFGFRAARVAETETHLDLALAAAETVLRETGQPADEVDVLLHAGGLTSSSTLALGEPPTGAALQLTDVTDLFRYPASRLQVELNLSRAAVAGISQQGCAAIFTAVRIGRDMLLAEPELRSVLCVAADRYPASARREIIYNVVSDGACALLLRRGAGCNRILALRHVTKGAFWDAGALENEVLAAYFPTARAVILDTLRAAELTVDDVDWVVPHNVSLRSWEILLGLLRIPPEKLLAGNIGRIGHTVAADNFVNLRDALDEGRIRRGDHLLLFTFGFGLHWSCMVLRH